MRIGLAVINNTQNAFAACLMSSTKEKDHIYWYANIILESKGDTYVFTGQHSNLHSDDKFEMIQIIHT